MIELSFLAWTFLSVSFVTSVINLTILVHLIRREKSDILEKNVDLNTKEFDLTQRQNMFLQAKTEVNSKRLETIEKVMSALIVSGTAGDDPGGFTH